MRSVGALRLLVGPRIAAASVSSSGDSFFMSNVSTFLPLATTTVAAVRARASACSRFLRCLLASTVSPPTDQPPCSRNSRDFTQLVQPLRWYKKSIVFAIGDLRVGGRPD